ncbi:MAG: DUF21 domain-containing protein, partial [Pseudomonadales bacterium]|nr:DUF21 domain-containing protein [Pseudomonadales bacterium]
VLLIITPHYAELKFQEGAAIGRHLRSFKQNIDRPLAAILTLNTIAHTVGAIGVGEQAARLWADSNPVMTRIFVPAAMTLAILVLSEIIPKTLGAVFWKRLAGFTVHSLLIIIAILAPFVWLSQLITRSFRTDQAGSVLSRSDFLAMAQLGAKKGVFEEKESEIITNLIRFNKVQAKDIMTPRTVVKAAPEEMSVKDYYEANQDLRFSRIPVYQEDDKDHITGYILKDELLIKLIHDETDLPIRSIKREIMVINEAFPMPDLFNRFITRKENIALVVDEFGGMAGIVTTEDVIETLLGLEIVDESDSAEDMQILARKNWERRARAVGLIEEVPQAVSNDESEPDDEEDEDSDEEQP